MRKISVYAIATFLILTGVGEWLASATQARVVAPASVVTIDPSQITKNHVGELPTEEYHDYTFVFD